MHPFLDELACYDTLEIKGLETKIFCGTTLPAPYTTKSIVLKLVLTSDDSIEQTGFDLLLTTYNDQLQWKYIPIYLCNNPCRLVWETKYKNLEPDQCVYSIHVQRWSHSQELTAANIG